MPSSSSEPTASASAVAQSTSPVGVQLAPGASNCLAELRVHREALRAQVDQRSKIRSSTAPVDAGGDVGQHTRSAAAGLASTSLAGGRLRGSRRARPAAGAWKSSSACSASSSGDVAALDQRLGVELAHRAALVDRLVHQRLGVARVVALVVAVAPVADHVDDDVLVEPLAVREREPGDAHARLGVVAVHVEDRRLDHLGDVGGVHRRAGGLRARW